MNADLGAFLKAGTARARDPGVWDCCAFPAAWAIACGFPDPMAPWRGAYATEADGERLADDAGGLVPLFEHGMGGAGLPDATAPWEAGDLAVVSLLGREAGAVFTGRRWSFVGPRGLAFASLDDECVLRAWGPLRRG